MPPATIGTGETASPNPAHSLWIRQDKLIYLALLDSCDSEAQSVMAAADTSRDAWLALARAFSNRPQSRIMSLRERLSSITKGNSSVSTYLHSIRSIADELALIGHPIDNLEMVIHALNGLGPTFREFTASIRTRDSPIAFNELYDKLVDFEMFLQREERISTPAPATANLAQRHYNNNGQGRYQPGRSNNYHGHASTPSNTKKPTLNNPIICQYCEKPGHSTKQCYKIHGNPNKPRHPTAHVAQQVLSHSSPPSWLFDSSASHHITNDLSNLSIKEDYHGTDNLQVANGNQLPITHIGSTTLSTNRSSLKLSDILYVPNVTQNLISVSQLCQTNKVSIEFFPWHFEVKDLHTKEILLRGLNEDNVYRLQPNAPVPHTSFATSNPSLKLWHHRLGHPAPPTLLHALKSNNIAYFGSLTKCLPCLSNKSHKLPFSMSSISSSYPLEILYSDLWGPTPVNSIDGFRYYVIFVDHFSKSVWLYPLKLKSDVSIIFPIFKNLVERQFNSQIKTLYSDNGGEYIKLRPFLQANGISHLTTPPHTPEHNGLSERKHRHLTETARCLLNHASLPPIYWSFAF